MLFRTLEGVWLVVMTKEEAEETAVMNLTRRGRRRWWCGENGGERERDRKRERVSGKKEKEKIAATTIKNEEKKIPVLVGRLTIHCIWFQQLQSSGTPNRTVQGCYESKPKENQWNDKMCFGYFHRIHVNKNKGGNNKICFNQWF